MFNFKKFYQRNIKKPLYWNRIRSLKPISEVFALDRGTPIDRFYIENFLNHNKKFITGVTLEIAESVYSKKFGTDIVSFEILHTDSQICPNATMIGNLTDITTLQENRIDCFICTQTFNFIYDYKAAIRGAHYVLKPGGVLLATIAGISQISRYDMDRWGDYWRFTTKSTTLIFAEVFGYDNIEVDFFGNVLTAISFLEGISKEELSINELTYKDPNYQLLITIKAIK